MGGPVKSELFDVFQTWIDPRLILEIIWFFFLPKNAPQKYTAGKFLDQQFYLFLLMKVGFPKSMIVTYGDRESIELLIRLGGAITN